MTRHGPMVLATCRAVLGHEQDVEDAFQATFLVLARKAGSVRAGDALGGWLHRVAYRAAVQASASARRRRLLETEAAIASLRSAPAETEIPGIVHEELDRLPDRQRLPLILCDLEDLTYEQAAMRLGWTEPTLRHRLVEARQRLRDRLARRGLNAGTLAGLVGPTAGARLEVPAALIRLAVAGAGGGGEGPAVSMIADGLVRIMLVARLKVAAVGLALALITVATAGVVAVGDRRNDKRAPSARKVAGMQGKALALAPTAEGKAQSKAQPPAEAGPGIEGRIVDLEGRPVPGVRIELVGLWTAPDNDLGKWLDRVRDVGVSTPTDGLSFPKMRALGPSPEPSPNSVRTDKDGRFRWMGVRTGEVAEIGMREPTTARVHVYGLGRDGAVVSVSIRQGMVGGQIFYRPRRFEYVVMPTKPLQGVVQDKESGQPLPGVTLRASMDVEGSLVPAPSVFTRTDHRGAYRLLGLPSLKTYRLFVEPGPGMSYPGITLKVHADMLSFDAVTFPVALKRGVLVRGRITEKETGKPVEASVDVYAFADNPHVRNYTGLSSIRSFTSDGFYEAVALPGRGIIGVLAGGDAPYRSQVGVGSIEGYNAEIFGYGTKPHICMPMKCHSLAELNLDPGAESATLDIQVERGGSIVVNPVDSDGRPVAGTLVAGMMDRLPSGEYPQETSSVKIEGLDPFRPRRVIVRHVARRLIGSVYLKGDEVGPLTLRLQPWGTLTGRLVDDEGRPRGGLGISSIGGINVSRPTEQAIFPQGSNGDGLRVGRDGRFRIEGLVPGLKYGAGTG